MIFALHFLGGWYNSTMKLSLPSIDIKKLQHSPFILIVWVILGFSLAAFAFSLVARPASSSKKVRQVVPTPPAVSVTVSNEIVVEVAPPEPVLPVAEEQAPAELPVFVLEGIIYSEQGQGSVALIDGKVVPEGTLIKGARVEKITPETVELSFEGTPITLRSR